MNYSHYPQTTPGKYTQHHARSDKESSNPVLDSLMLRFGGIQPFSTGEDSGFRFVLKGMSNHPISRGAADA